jgi:hypothetical protein
MSKQWHRRLPARAAHRRFAFRYLCAADTVNYIGIDSVRVVTAVPEPSGFLMLGLGLTAFGLALRKLSH